MAAITICSDFGAQKNKVWLCVHCFPIYHFPMKWWDRMPWSSFSECWALGQLFHSPLSLSSRGEWKSWLKAQHSENEDHGIRPITPWEIDGETVETVSDFIFGGSKITAHGDCSHEIKRRLLLGRKVMTNPDSIFKSRDITLPTKVRLVKAMVFPVVMYGWMWELDSEES